MAGIRYEHENVITIYKFGRWKSRRSGNMLSGGHIVDPSKACKDMERKMKNMELEIVELKKQNAVLKKELQDFKTSKLQKGEAGVALGDSAFLMFIPEEIVYDHIRPSYRLHVTCKQMWNTVPKEVRGWLSSLQDESCSNKRSASSSSSDGRDFKTPGGFVYGRLFHQLVLSNVLFDWFWRQDCTPDQRLCTAAAGFGDVKMMEKLYAIGGKFEKPACDLAAFKGNFSVVKWLREKGGESWEQATCKRAAAGGHLEIVKWALENGSVCDKYACAFAAAGGQIEVLKWMYSSGNGFDKSNCFAGAVRLSQIKVLEWMNGEEGLYWDDIVCATMAARCGSINVLKWLGSNECSWDKSIFNAAARGGHIEILEFLMTNGCPCERIVCMNDAYHNGQYKTVQWLNDHVPA